MDGGLLVRWNEGGTGGGGDLSHGICSDCNIFLTTD